MTRRDPLSWPDTPAELADDMGAPLRRRIGAFIAATLNYVVISYHAVWYHSTHMASPPETPDPPEWESLYFDDRVAICHRDTSRGGVKRDPSGFLFRPFGECIISDEFVTLAEMA